MTQEHLDMLKKIDGIHGSVSSKEAVYLYEQAKKCKEGVIVELGSWYGRSTICLGLGSKAGYGAKVYAIDPHTGSPDQRTYKKVNTFESFKQNIKNAGLEDVIVPIVDTSEKAARSWIHPIEFVFADANYYDYEETKMDFFLWSKFLTKIGIYSIHGTVPSVSGILEGIPLHGWEAPKKFLRDFVFGSKNLRIVAIKGTITAIQKTDGLSFLDKIKNRVFHLKSAIFFLNHKMYLTFANLPPQIKKPLKSLFR